MDTPKLGTLVICMALSLAIARTSHAQPEKETCLTGHNDLRAKSGAPPLSWDAALAEKAQLAAERRKGEGGCAEEPPEMPMGENVFPSNEGNPIDAIHQLMHTMEWESYAYDVTTQSCPEFYPCAHFVRMASPRTLRLGCSAVACEVGGGSLVVCLYDPPHPPVPPTPAHGGLSVVTPRSILD